MKSICYIVLYFGKLPDIMPLWLKSCSYNPSINWLVITNDKSSFIVPKNVRFIYKSFEEIKLRFQSKFDFPIKLDSPYRLCDYKVAYGYLFEEELCPYDFWGYCDLDMIFGDIRYFITDDVLSTYNRIGFLGHSTLYRNDSEINRLFMDKVDGEEIYKKIFTTAGSINSFFDEKWMDIICEKAGVATYRETIFADIIPWAWKFRIGYSSSEEKIKNEHRIFYWDHGKLYSYSLERKGKLLCDEFMYIHFLRRRMKLKFSINDNKLLIVPNSIKTYNRCITPKIVKRYSSNLMILYWFELLKTKWRKLSIKNVINYFVVRNNAKKKYYSKNSKR